MNELTPREQELLHYIIMFKKVNGYSPTLHEMMEGINTKSYNHVRMMLAKLSDLGYIKQKYNKPRAIRVLKFI